MKSCDVGSKLERKTVEKIRRMNMKSLCFKLSSLIPKDNYYYSKDTTQQDHLDQAATYIQKLKERIERLKQKKETGSQIYRGFAGDTSVVGYRLPLIEVRRIESSLEVGLISSLEKRFVFHEVIRALEEEGVEVANASFSTVGDQIYHTVHSKVISSRVGSDASRISQRLKELIR